MVYLPFASVVSQCATFPSSGTGYAQTCSPSIGSPGASSVTVPDIDPDAAAAAGSIAAHRQTNAESAKTAAPAVPLPIEFP
jgi:hypothetical protein